MFTAPANAAKFDSHNRAMNRKTLQAAMRNSR